MASLVSRPAVTGIFALTLEKVAEAQNISTAQVLRDLMTDAWGPDLENAPTQTGPVEPNQVQAQVGAQSKPQTQTEQQVQAEDLFNCRA